MPIYEQTLILIKPDAIARALVGRIVNKFEDAGLKLDAFKVAIAKEELLLHHYAYDRKWFSSIGKKALSEFKLWNLDIYKYHKTRDPVKIGEQIYKWHIEDLSGKAVVVGVLSGPHAIERVKQIVGATEPMEALRGTIRGDWCTDSVIYSNTQRRSIMNLVHRSSNVDEFGREKETWFN